MIFKLTNCKRCKKEINQYKRRDSLFCGDVCRKAFWDITHPEKRKYYCKQENIVNDFQKHNKLNVVIREW